MKFKLSDSFLEKYKKIKPPFGFNGLGELVYLRTYSRIKENGQNEQWWETIQRVVEGTFNLQQEHINKYNLGWSNKKAHHSAQEMYDRIFNMKFLPPGRGLWAMGSAITEEKRLFAALNNPLHIDTQVLTKEYGWIKLGDIPSEKVTVLSNTKLYGRDNSTAANAVWVEGQVSKIEKQPCIEITYQSKWGESYTVVSSVNHRWFRRKNTFAKWERVNATELNIGDWLPRTKTPKYYKTSIQGTQIKLVSTSSNFKENRELYELQFDKSDVGEDFFLKDEHKQIFKLKNDNRNQDWLKVTSIQKIDEDQTVRCITVPEYEQFVIEGFCLVSNCGFITTENIKDDLASPFCFLMDASMLGVGVGFDTKGAGKINVKGCNKKHSINYQIPDTREGWVESVKLLIESYLTEAPEVFFDYSLIRKEGESIKGFGGLSSGHQPLLEAHERIRQSLNKNIGSEISVTTIVDIMNMIGAAVVAGNVRRTAEIVFGDFNSEEYLKLKDYRWNSDKNTYEGSQKERADWGWTSNNSIFAELGMDYSQVAEQTSKNGEPGYAWLENMKAYSKMDGLPDNKDHRVTGGNPSLRKGTKIFTTNGIHEIQDLEGKEFSVRNLNNQISKAKCFLSGKNKELLKITLTGGKIYYATPEHEWPILQKDGTFKKVKTENLQNKTYLPVIKNNSISSGGLGNYEDGFLIAWLYGDGWLTKQTDNNKNQYGWIVSKNKNERDVCDRLIKTLKNNCPTFDGSFNLNKGCFELNTTHKEVDNYLKKFGVDNKHRGLPVKIWTECSEDFIRGFIDGIFSSDGSVEKNGRISLFSSCENLINDISELLGFYGIKNSIVKRERLGNFPNKKDYRKTFTNYTLRINTAGSQKHFKSIFSLSLKYKQDRLISHTLKTKKQYENIIEIKSIEKTPLREDVWDITVYDETHCFQLSHCITGNCLEQSLESYELCCLVETFPNNHKDLNDFLITLKYAYLYAKTVTLGQTHWAETNRVLLRNRRIGCSMSGIAQFLTNKGIQELKQWCESGYKAIEKYDEIYSDWFCIPKSIKKTSVKPSGSVSLLAGATPGVHFPESKYYIRRMRIGINSDLIEPLKIAGYKVEPCIGSEASTLVVEIPVCVGDNIRTIDDLNIWEQLSLAAFMQKYWADNQVSCTVTFKKSEANQIKTALDYFQYQLKGISFLPKIESKAYAQMPYEEISKDDYDSLILKIKTIKFKKISNEAADVEKFCNNDVCLIK